jgi:hypothetical protein
MSVPPGWGACVDSVNEAFIIKIKEQKVSDVFAVT